MIGRKLIFLKKSIWIEFGRKTSTVPSEAGLDLSLNLTILKSCQYYRFSLIIVLDNSFVILYNKKKGY